MISDLPIYVYATFFLALIFVLAIFYYASNKNLKLFIGIIAWGTLHSALAYSGFYENMKTVPPRMMLIVFPIVIIIISSIFSQKMKKWLSSLDLKKLLYLQVVRVPVELTLFWLFMANYVPEIITFEGQNFDIIAGVTAPIMALIAFRNNKINKPLLWTWHILSILLLLNIIITALISTPTVFQQIAFEQPNLAMFRFPFLLLPGIIVPLVLVSNIAGFVILSRQRTEISKQ